MPRIQGSWITYLKMINNLQILSGNHFAIYAHCEHDLWPTDPKTNKDHLLIMTNPFVK